MTDAIALSPIDLAALAAALLPLGGWLAWCWWAGTGAEATPAPAPPAPVLPPVLGQLERGAPPLWPEALLRLASCPRCRALLYLVGVARVRGYPPELIAVDAWEMVATLAGEPRRVAAHRCEREGRDGD